MIHDTIWTDRLHLFGHVERKDENDSVKHEVKTSASKYTKEKIGIENWKNKLHIPVPTATK